MALDYDHANARAACAAIAAWLAAAPAAAQAPEPGFADALLGRWDLTVEAADGAYPSWLEVRLRTETELMGRFVGRVGSARYVSRHRRSPRAGSRFACPCSTSSDVDELRFEGTLRGDRIEGTTLAEDGAARALHGDARAGARARGVAARWRARGAAQRPRPRRAGRRAARSTRVAGACRRACSRRRRPASISSRDATFGDFRLHAELKFPPGSNSGVYLRGRYEVQIQDDAGKALDPLRMGGVYGFIAPSVDAARAAGEWQTLDVELVGRRVTVVLNGTTIVDGQEIPGITGGALDSDEGEPGPIMLQGDHGAIEFRNVTIAPAR